MNDFFIIWIVRKIRHVLNVENETAQNFEFLHRKKKEEKISQMKNAVTV